MTSHDEHRHRSGLSDGVRVRRRADGPASGDADRVVAVAVGVVMAREGLTAERALQRLEAVGRASNRPLADLAEQVVATRSLPDPT